MQRGEEEEGIRCRLDLKAKEDGLQQSMLPGDARFQADLWRWPERFSLRFPFAYPVFSFASK